jgi:hypothetical protein
MSNFNLTEKLKEELKKRNLWEQDDDEEDDDDETTMTKRTLTKTTKRTLTKTIPNLPIIMKISVRWHVKYYTLKNKLTFFI